MGLFTRKKNRVEVEAYYIIDGDLYMFRKVEFLTEKESKSNLTRDEFFNKYGFYIRKYDLECDSFDVWYITRCDSMKENPFDMTKAVEVNEEDLDDAIERTKKAFEKKFNDFELNETLYTYNKYSDSTFPPVAKVRKKLINKQAENIVQQLLLEIEVLNGQEGHTKREFITFYDFLNYYDEGCPIKVIDSNGDYENSIDDFFW